MKKVLVIEDDPINVDFLEALLQKENFEVTSAVRGKEGIKKAFEVVPDIILLDIMMPDISGFEVCERLHNDPITKHSPIILVTALSDTENLERGLEAGAFDYIAKPFNKSELLIRVNGALRYSLTQNMYRELEKQHIYQATVTTANHKIKQPLTTVNLIISSMRRELAKNPNEKITEKLNLLEESLDKVQSILTKLNDIKKPNVKDFIDNMKIIDIDSDEETE